MRYRVRKLDQYGGEDFTYRKTLKAAVKNANPKGAIVWQQEDQYARWEAIGVAFEGEFLPGQEWVDAFRLSKAWEGHWSHTSAWDQKLKFKAVAEAGEIKFPYRYCGLDNHLCTPKRVGAIERGPDFNDDYHNGQYHYVVTDYGRKLIDLLQKFVKKS